VSAIISLQNGFASVTAQGVTKTLLEIERFGNKPRAVGMKCPLRVMTSSRARTIQFETTQSGKILAHALDYR